MTEVMTDGFFKFNFCFCVLGIAFCRNAFGNDDKAKKYRFINLFAHFLFMGRRILSFPVNCDGAHQLSRSTYLESF